MLVRILEEVRMSPAVSDPLTYYALPGPVTTLPDTPAIQDLLAGLPATIPALVEAVQGNLLHIFWATRYGVELSDERKAEVNVRTPAARLERIHAADPAPLTVPRAPEKKSVGNCRDFSVLLCALLRYQGIPARARCGFGTYFTPQQYEDHWICEFWNADQARWVQVDAQLDKIQCVALKTDFDPLDVPRVRFISGGRAWQMCRQEGVSPDRFGIFDMRGLWFVRGDLIRDLAALNKMELLPWDCWGLSDQPDESVSGEELALLDQVAALTLAGNDRFGEMRALYDADKRLRVPPVISSYPGGPEPIQVTLAEEVGFAAISQP
jgi:hypothetical protein